ncbi:MAG: rhodanese-like domain-containing protein [Bacteroidia bacterium]|nr:rhodanese-like domain-containing protein [Bacteroidia bacterium]
MKEITVRELKDKMDNKEQFQLIDVREQFEYDVANISGELIPMQSVIEQYDRIETDKPVIIYCRSGNRSAVVVNELEKRFGFTNLYSLKGGIIAWSNEIDPSIPKY